MFDSIPAERREAARSAVAAAFGASAQVTLQPVTGGASAMIHRLDVAGRPYLLRIEAPDGGLRDAKRGFACMHIAAEACVAPPVIHADPETGVAIMQFIALQPLDAYPGGPAGLVRGVGELIARLQAAPAFPPAGDYAVIIERVLDYVRGSPLFAPGLLDPHLERFQQVCEAYPWASSPGVSASNDPNARNVLYDGERLWLVDWELSFRNDPFVDVAILADNFAHTPELVEGLLKAWLGRAPDPFDHARFTLMRPMTRLFYAAILFSRFAGVPRETPETDLTPMTPAELRAAVAEGRLSNAGLDTLYALGKMMLAGFMTGASAPGFEEAMAVARQG